MTSPFALGFGDAGSHALMLLDTVRLESFAAAIRAKVRPGDIVADVGAGTGILACLAARAGAARVYAIERGPLATVAQEIVRTNGLDGVVRVLRGDAREVVLPQPPNVVVSETLGSLGPDEDMLGLLKVFAARCTPDVRFIPEDVETFLFPLWDDVLAREQAAFAHLQGLRFDAFHTLLTQRVRVERMTGAELRGPPVGTGSWTVGSAEAPEEFRVELRPTPAEPINAVGAYFESTLEPGIVLSTNPEAPRTSWRNLKFPLVPPLACAANQGIFFRLTMRHPSLRRTWRWEATTEDETRTMDLWRLNLAKGPDSEIRLSAGGDEEAVWSSRTLQVWTAILGGQPEGSIELLSERLRSRWPEQYASVADARQEVIAMLSAAHALR